MSRVLLCVDLSYQVYRAAASHPMLSSVTGVFTGGLYGFLASFSKAVRETGATDVVVCRDSKPYLRSRDYPDYKQVRKKDQDPDLLRMYKETEPLVLDALDLTGVPTWMCKGFESDDLIGHAVRRHRGRFQRVYAASNDSDLYQLLGAPQFSVYKDDIRTCVNEANLKLDKLQCTPEEHMLASALTGTHNDIEGIKGVGPVNALKAVRDPALMRKHRGTHAAIIDRNLALIRLPHAELPNLALPQRTRRFSSRDLYRWAARFDIDVTLSMVNAFEQIDT